MTEVNSVYPATENYTPGVAPIKKDFILPHKLSDRSDEPNHDAAEASTDPSNHASTTVRPAPELADPSAPAPFKLKGAARKRARREEAAAAFAESKKLKQDAPSKGGSMNKNRLFHRMKDSVGLCHSFLSTSECQYGDDCRYSHDLVQYLVEKPRDIAFAKPPSAASTLNHFEAKEREEWLQQHYSTENTGEETHVREVREEAAIMLTDPVHKSIDFATCCPNFYVKGYCSLGWKCRFLGAHVKVVGPSRLAAAGAKSESEDVPKGTGFGGSGLELVRDEEKLKAWRSRDRTFVTTSGKDNVDKEETNYASAAGMKALRTRKFPLLKTKAALEYLEKEGQELAKLDPHGTTAGRGPLPLDLDQLEQQAIETEEVNIEELENELRNTTSQRQAEASTSHTSIDTARIRPSEKKRLNWRGELYLAPLTTAGNLPFRRLCSSYGSDIHCGEMGLAESFLHGNNSEWSLVRRWEGERIFGTQLCGSKPNLLVPVAEALKKEMGDGLDFVDINCGCPIDLVYNKGAGSALLDQATRLSKIVRGMNAVLGETPLTIKLRTGTSSKQTTHKLFARLQTEWGVSAATIHGRSRKQRYKNDADWGYIKTCANSLRDSVRRWNEEEGGVDGEEMVPIPIYGNGDVFSWQDYYERLDRTGVDGEMIARGALIKPWLFTEIKERRDWDISSRERLDMMRQYASHGLSHWGSDTQGVNTTRRFMCEMLSFTHRYVPTGILEHLPARMNDRPPPFKGRDELETLLASPNSQDWVKISEMFLGKAPEEWSFTPKHKSSSFADGREEQQG